MFRIASRQSRRPFQKKSRPNERSLRVEYLEPRLALSGGSAVELMPVSEATETLDWIIAPYALSSTSACMTVKQVEGQEYCFYNLTSGTDSGWITEADNTAYFNYAGYVTYVDTNLSVGQEYNFKVEAQNASEEVIEYSTEQTVTTMTEMENAAQNLVNQIRAVETFSNPNNPGRIIAQLVPNGYPDPDAANDNDPATCEQSGTHGEGAYPGDLRNTPGAFQVDLGNLNGYEITEEGKPKMVEIFGQWLNTVGKFKNSTVYDTQIAFSRNTLETFFNIELTDEGLIDYIEAPAASVFLHDDSLAESTDWDPEVNQLIGLHIDGFQEEQLSLYLASRLPEDSTVGVTDTRTTSPTVLQLSNQMQYQTSKSFLWSIYQRYLTQPSYDDVFPAITGLYGLKLSITSSQGVNTTIFGVMKDQIFECRLTPGFVLGGAYVSGEAAMYGLLKGILNAHVTGTGTWEGITFTKVIPESGETYISVDKTPENVGPDNPSIFHYAAVTSQFGLIDYTADPTDPSNYTEGKLIDMSDETAWGISDARETADLDYPRLTEQAVTGAQTLTTGGLYSYKGLQDGRTLVLQGEENFIIRSLISCTVTATKYKDPCNCNQTVPKGRLIDVSSFFDSKDINNNEELLNSSFYVWWIEGKLYTARVTENLVFSEINAPIYLYIVPKAQTAEGYANMVKALEDWTFGSPGTEFVCSARLLLAEKDMLGTPTSASQWAEHFVTYAYGTGVIDASATTGNVYILADKSIQKVKLGTGTTTVIVTGNTDERKTYVFNSDATTETVNTIDLHSGDIIDWSGLSDSTEWTSGTVLSYDCNTSLYPYFRYSYDAGWTGTLAAETVYAFEALVHSNGTTGADDPTAIVDNALNPTTVTINLASTQALQTSASLLTYTVEFSEEMDDFDGTDVTLSGTAGTIEGASIVVTNEGNDMKYTVAITLEDTASTGSVIATIADGAVHNEEGFTNLASTSTSNTVAYVPNTISGYGMSNPNQLLGGGEYLPGVMVTLTSSTPGFAARITTTDNEGYYEFENVPDGTYEVTVTCPNACLDTGSDTATVTVEDSQTLDADFSFGALKPSCIPNRMTAASSLPIGSTNWHLVVQEALSLGGDTVSQAATASAAVTSQTSVAQYLVLDTETDEQDLVDSEVTIASVNATEVVETTVPQADNQLEESATVEIVSVAASAEMPIVEEEVEEVAEVVEIQAAAQVEEITTVEVVSVAVFAEMAIIENEVEEDETPIVEATEVEPVEQVEETTVVEVASVAVAAEETAVEEDNEVEEDNASIVEIADVESAVQEEVAITEVVATVDVSSDVAIVEGDDEPVVETVDVVSDTPAVAEDNVEVVDTTLTQEESEPEAITQETIAPIVEEAIARWVAAGLDQASLDMMQNATFLIADLDGVSLGMAIDDTVWLDLDAAGCGWFVDSTPEDDAEFTSALAEAALRAIDSEVSDQVDLLTVIAHELGHIAGLDDLDDDGLMSPSLKTGWRLNPSAHDAALASLSF